MSPSQKSETKGPETTRKKDGVIAFRVPSHWREISEEIAEREYKGLSTVYTEIFLAGMRSMNLVQ